MSSALQKFQKFHETSIPQIKKLHNIHLNQTIYCLGCGPSLKKEDISLLNGKIVIFTNSSYKLMDRCRPKKSYYIITSVQRMKELRDEVALLDGVKFSASDFYTDEYAHLYGPPFLFLWSNGRIKDGVYRPDHGVGFSNDMTKEVYGGYSVIFSAIQVASYLGAKNIVCLGIDMDYSNTKNNYWDMKLHKVYWEEFRYELHAKDMLINFRKNLEEMGKRFINATQGGRVDVLERMPLEKTLYL